MQNPEKKPSGITENNKYTFIEKIFIMITIIIRSCITTRIFCAGSEHFLGAKIRVGKINERDNAI